MNDIGYIRSEDFIKYKVLLNKFTGNIEINEDENNIDKEDTIIYFEEEYDINKLNELDIEVSKQEYTKCGI